MLLNLLAFLSVKHILIKVPSYIWYSLDVFNYLTKYFPFNLKKTHTQMQLGEIFYKINMHLAPYSLLLYTELSLQLVGTLHTDEMKQLQRGMPIWPFTSTFWLIQT